MASSSSLHTNLPLLRVPTPIATRTSNLRRLSINCGGPRSNRGPLIKGRILSIEAIHAIQALKRHSSSLDSHASKILPRLIKSDLVSTFKELLRQRHFRIALKVFSAIRAEYSPDLTLYADLVNGLASQGLTEEIDALVADLEEIDLEDKGVVKLVKALVEARRREASVRVYGVLKKCGWDCSSEMDEYVAQVLSKGFRIMGEEILADQIDTQLSTLFKTHLAKPVV